MKPKKLRVGSWNACGFATEERKRLELAEQVSKRDLDVVGIEDSWEKEGGRSGMQSWKVRMDRNKEEGTG